MVRSTTTASLRRELEGLGHQFATDHADSEVIPHGYEAWGDGFLDRLRGMFAIALWDAEKERLLLARDRLGEKPVYFRHRGDLISFASEIHALEDRADTVDLQALRLVYDVVSVDYYVRMERAVWPGPRRTRSRRSGLRPAAR